MAVGKLNAAIALSEPWFRKWRTQANTKKCTITLFSRRSRYYRGSMCPVKICNGNIAWTNETHYLGVTLDSKLTHGTHISCLHSAQLFPILNKSSTIDINLALII
jgi:hypothetical protein